MTAFAYGNPLMKPQHPPSVLCPSCGVPLNACGGPYDNGPEPGDITLCVYCHAVLIFEQAGERLTLRQPTDDEMIELRSDPTVAANFLALALAAGALPIAKPPEEN